MSPKVEYFTPKTIEEACSLAFKYKEEAKIIAGGTDLLVQVKHKEVLHETIRGRSGERRVQAKKKRRTSENVHK